MNLKNSKYFILFLLILCLSRSTSKASDKQLDSLLALSAILKNDTNKANVLINIAESYGNKNFIKTIQYSKISLRLSRLLGYNEGKLRSLINLENAYDYSGRYSEAQKLNFQLLAIYQSKNDTDGMNTTYNNIGIIHYYLGNYNQAIEFTTKALEYYLTTKDSNGMSVCYNNLANSYSNQTNYEKALEYYFKALKIDEVANDQNGISLIKGNIGEVYIEQEKYDKAFGVLINALHIADKEKDEWQQANIFSALGDLLSRQGKPDDAISFLFKALEINERIGAKANISEIYDAISKVFQQKGDYIQSLHYLKLKNEITDKLYSIENSKKIAEMDALYEISEKEKEILKQEANSSLQKAQTKALIIGSLIGFALLFIIVGISVKGNLDKRKINTILEIQNKQIETKNREITDSIQYAKRIQGAIFPSEVKVKKYFKDSFIFYLPKDIVAGDFYWVDTNNEHILFAAGDCTGHGVPGAMVSVVCHNALNRAVREFQLSQPAQILDKVTELVIETFEQSDANIKDGMDIALCSLNLKNNELQYAGANNSMYLIRDNKLIEIKSDKQPIGKFSNIKPFTNHKQKVLENDKIYLFTDGYADQFGGKKGKKFKYKQFKELILVNNNKPMKDQLKALTKSFYIWKGELEQIDDVCVIGVSI